MSGRQDARTKELTTAEGGEGVADEGGGKPVPSPAGGCLPAWSG